MLKGGTDHEVRFPAILEIQANVLKELGLVAFDGEVVMCLPVLDQIAGETPLSQQRIGGDILALDIDGLEQRSSRLDLVGAFGLLIARYGQGTDFFWV